VRAECNRIPQKRKMKTGEEAKQIAENLLRAKNIAFGGNVDVCLMPGLAQYELWVCSFLAPMPEGAIDSPGVIIVQVNPITGDARLFDTL
jgi:hypothetical protein